MAPLPKLFFNWPWKMPEGGDFNIFGSYKGYGQTGPGRWNAEWKRVKQPPPVEVKWFPFSLEGYKPRYPWQKNYGPFSKPNKGGVWAEGFDIAQMKWMAKLAHGRFGTQLRGAIKQSLQIWFTGLVEAHLNKKCHKNPESLGDCYQRLGKEKEDACLANPKAKDCLFVLDEYCDILCQGCLGKTVAPTCLVCADTLGKLQTAVTAELKRGVEFAQSEYAKAKGWNGTMEPVLEVVESKKKSKKGKKKDKKEKRSSVSMDAPSNARIANTTTLPARPHGEALTFHRDNQFMLVGWHNGTNTTARVNLTEFPYMIGDMRSQVLTQLLLLDPADVAKVQQISEPMSATVAILVILSTLLFLVLVIGVLFHTVKGFVHWRARRSTVSMATLTEEDVELKEMMKEDQ